MMKLERDEITKAIKVIYDELYIKPPQELYKELYIRNGKKQFMNPLEEMAELSKEILKYLRDDCPDKKAIRENIKEEIGDVFNAIESIMYILEIDKAEIEETRIKKLEEYLSKNRSEVSARKLNQET